MLVVVIIGLIAAIAIPKFSRGAAGAADSAVGANLTVLRKAIDHFHMEHGAVYPDTQKIAAQLTQYSDASGNTSTTKDATHIYGPYLRSLPGLPVGARKGQCGIAVVDGATVGWIYNSATGVIQPNTTTETDSAGNLYTNYGDGLAFPNNTGSSSNGSNDANGSGNNSGNNNGDNGNHYGQTKRPPPVSPYQ